MSAQVYSAPCQTEERRKTFLEWTSIDLSSTCGGNVNYYKSVHHPIPTLLFSEQISKLSCQLSVQVYSLHGQSEVERKTKKGAALSPLRLPTRARGCYERWKSLSFCEIWYNTTPLLLLIIPPYKWALQDMELFDKFVDIFQEFSKVQNPPVSKAKV